MFKFQGNQWYAVQTKSNFERALSKELQLKGISSFCPEIAEVHEWADRKKTIMKPVFKGYVFANFPGNVEGRVAVLSCAGAVRILGKAQQIEQSIEEPKKSSTVPSQVVVPSGHGSMPVSNPV